MMHGLTAVQALDDYGGVDELYRHEPGIESQETKFRQVPGYEALLLYTYNFVDEKLKGCSPGVNIVLTDFFLLL